MINQHIILALILEMTKVFLSIINGSDVSVPLIVIAQVLVGLGIGFGLCLFIHEISDLKNRICQIKV